jgi:YVTN family beta-propeller protein
VSPDNNKVYVTNLNSNTVSVIDTRTNKIITAIPVGIGPIGVSVSPDGGKVYVANSGSNNISLINTSDNTVITTIPVGSHPVALGLFIQPTLKSFQPPQ